MPEQEHPTSPIPERVNTYEEVLARHPDMHPDLRTHVQQLALESQAKIEEPKAPEKGTMAFLLHETDKQMHELATTSVTDKIPRTEFPYDTWGVLKKGGYSPEELGEFFNKQVAMQEEVQKRVSKSAELYEKLNVRDFLRHLEAIPTDTLRTLYNAPPEQSKGLRTIMRNADDEFDRHCVLERLADIYEVSDILELYKPGTIANKDETFAHLERQWDADYVPLVALSRHEINWGRTPEAQSSARRDWADQYLERVVGLPRAMRDDLLFASYSRVSGKDGFADRDKLRHMLLEVAQKTNQLGLTTVKELNEKAGIVNLDYFSVDQLQLTKDALDGDPNTVKHLQEQDVIVVMATVRGDYNGALRGTAENYTTKDKRTLAFEIGQPSDFYRHLIRLEKLGIKPSTLVAGAHGAVGFMNFGINENGFALGKDYFDSSAPAKIVERFMQDARGINEQESKGIRRIILDACNQGKEGATTRPRQPHEKRQKLIHYVTRRGKRDVLDVTESSAQTITRAAQHPNLRVYGAPETVVPTRSGNVMRYRTDDPDNPLVKPTYATVQRSYIDRYGIVHTSQIEEIVIDKAEERAAA